LLLTAPAAAEDWHARQEKGIELANAGRLREALPHFEVAARLKPDEPQLSNLGVTHMRLKQFAKAHKAFKAAELINPESQVLKNNLAALRRERAKAKRVAVDAASADTEEMEPDDDAGSGEPEPPPPLPPSPAQPAAHDQTIDATLRAIGAAPATQEARMAAAAARFAGASATDVAPWFGGWWRNASARAPMAAHLADGGVVQLVDVLAHDVFHRIEGS